LFILAEANRNEGASSIRSGPKRSAAMTFASSRDASPNPCQLIHRLGLGVGSSPDGRLLATASNDKMALWG
jgi:hypothetical protein